jgi:hypothetical protein
MAGLGAKRCPAIGDWFCFDLERRYDYSHARLEPMDGNHCDWLRHALVSVEDELICFSFSSSKL